MPMPSVPPAARPAAPARAWARARAFVGPPGSGRRVLVRNGAWETTSFAAQALVMFFLSPFVVARLGTSPYGVWEIVVALTGYLGFADLGVRPAAVHFVARNDAQGDFESLNRFVNAAFLVFALAGAAILLLAGPLALALPRFWRVQPGYETPAAIALLLVAAELALTLPLNAFSAVLVGKQRYDVLARARLVVLAVKTTGIVLVLANGGGLLALAAVVAGSGLLGMAWYTALAFRLEPRLRFSPRLADRVSFRALLRFGGWATVVSVALQVTWATDPLVIGRALSPTAVAWFAIGFKLAYYARDLLRVAARVVEPAAGALQAKDDREGIRRMLQGSSRVVLLLAGPIVVYLLVFGRAFLDRWMGPEFADASSGVLFVMTLAVVPAIASGPIVAAHYGMARVRPLALLLILEGALNLGLSVLLVGRFGIVGVAWGTALPAYLVHGVLLPLSVCREQRVGLVGWWRSTWAGPVLAALPAGVLLFLVVPADARFSWPALVLLAGLCVALCLAGALGVRRLAPALFGDAGRLLPTRPQTEPA